LSLLLFFIDISSFFYFFDYNNDGGQMTKQLLKSIGIILAGGMVWISLFSLAQSAGPKVFVPQNSWEFGKTPQGQQVSHVFWIKNEGTDTLLILDVKPG
jgi:hypothetical protein